MSAVSLLRERKSASARVLLPPIARAWLRTAAVLARGSAAALEPIYGDGPGTWLVFARWTLR